MKEAKIREILDGFYARLYAELGYPMHISFDPCKELVIVCVYLVPTAESKRTKKRILEMKKGLPEDWLMEIFTCSKEELESDYPELYGEIMSEYLYGREMRIW
ncbi:MAG: hypothetical protein WC145_07910 [Aliarcobacter sp.]|jgi:hypothetical protein